MINNIQNLVDQYHSWLKDNTFLREISREWVEVTTPYIDRHNDFIQIYISRVNGELQLTDDANTISDLLVSGCDLSTPKRSQLLDVTLNGFGVHRDGDSLTIKANASNFAWWFQTFSATRSLMTSSGFK